MKKVLTLICFLLSFQIVSYGQYDRAKIYQVGLLPSNPNTSDSIDLPLQIVFTDYGAIKWSSLLNIYADTIVYNGCYYCACVGATPSFAYDTIKLSPLPAGLYHVVIIARTAHNFQDTFCANGNPTYSDTANTVFTVSQVNSIETPSSSSFYAFLENFNTLIINAETPGALNVKLYDELGRQVSHTNKINIQQGNNSVNLQIPALSPGIYFYHLSMGDKERILKYMKM
jgi:hypothetical protein